MPEILQEGSAALPKPRGEYVLIRRAAASLLIRLGVNVVHVRQAMGHSNGATTLGIYRQIFEEDDTISTVSRAPWATFDATTTRLSGSGRMQDMANSG